MERRDFLAGAGASIMSASLLGGIPSAQPEPALIGWLGKWAGSIARDIAIQLPGLQVVTAKQLAEMYRLRNLFGLRIALVGALGGQTGLKTAAAYAAVSRTKSAYLDAIVVMPGYWEGQHRMDAANAALRALGSGQVSIQVLDPRVAANQTLQAWGDARKKALSDHFLDSLGRH